MQINHLAGEMDGRGLTMAAPHLLEPSDDISKFLSAGFSPDQYELMAGRINSALGTIQKSAR